MLDRVEADAAPATAILRRLIDEAGLAFLVNPRPPFWDDAQIMALSRRARPNAAMAMRLFLAGEECRADEIEGAFGAADADALLEAGLLCRFGDVVRSPRLLVNWRHRYVLVAPPPGHPRFNATGVPYCGPESLRFADALVGHGPYRTSLDLCTGSGLIALMTAAEETVAVDIDDTAARVAALNTRLNGREGMRVEVGDLFSPVGGDRFDLISANPPFLPDAPDGALPVCGAGGPTGPEIVLRILEVLPDYLTASGEAFVYAESFGDHRGPTLWAAAENAIRSRRHDLTCWVDSSASGSDAAVRLCAVWQSVGIDERAAWAHWRDLSARMPTNRYFTMIFHLRPGTGVAEIRSKFSGARP